MLPAVEARRGILNTTTTITCSRNRNTAGLHMTRMLVAAVALCCCTVPAATAGRSLLLTDEQLQANIKAVDQAAGSAFSQLSNAVASSGVLSDGSSSSDLKDRTLDAINRNAPHWKTDAGYFIRPQVASELYNAVNHLGPAHPSFLAAAPQSAAQVPAAATQSLQAPAASSSMASPEGGRRLMQAMDYALAPAAAPGPWTGAAAAAAFELLPGFAAAAAPSGDGWAVSAASPGADLYTSYNKKQNKKKAAAEAVQGGAGAAAAQGTITNAGPAVGAFNDVERAKLLAAASPTAAPAVQQQASSSGNPRQVTSLAQDLQPKSTSSAGGVSLDPNRPNALPGPLRLATQQQAAASGYSAQPKSATAITDDTAFAGTPANKLPGPLRIDSTTPFDGPSVSGSEISLVLGTRIATPFFGTGFNFCIDRYFGSFPKVGIVIPNPGQWLLPELQDIGRTLQTTLQLPPDATIGHGLTLQPTSDGFLIFLPSVQPNNINDFGVRYGIQIGQAFGYDFGIGVLRDICFISFTTV